MYQKRLFKKSNLKRRIIKLFSLILIFQLLLLNLFSGSSFMQVKASEGSLLYENKDIVKVEDVDFSNNQEEDWGAKKEVTYAYTNDVEINVAKNYTVDATINIDEEALTSLEVEGSYIKFQGVVKLGDGWTYVSGDSWPMLEYEDFYNENGEYSSKIEIDFKDQNPSN